MANVKLEIKMNSSQTGTSIFYDPENPPSSNHTLNVYTYSGFPNNNVGFKTDLSGLSEQEYAMYTLRKLYEALTLESSSSLTDAQVLQNLCTIYNVSYDADSFTNTFNNLYVEIIGSQPSGNFDSDTEDIAKYYGLDTGKQYLQTNSDNFNGTELLSWQGEQGFLYFNNEKKLCNSKTSISGKLSSEQTNRQFVFKRNLEDNEFEIEFTLSVGISLPQYYFKKILITGDKFANQFPTEAIIDNSKTIHSDDPYWVISFDSMATSHTIKFTKWNRKNYNAVINSIIIMYEYYSIDNYNGLKEVNNLIQSTSSPDGIFYGIISSSGYAEVIDIDGEIKDLIEDGIIPKSDVPIILKIKDNSVNYGVILDSSYNETKEYNVNINNKLGYLENIKFSFDYKEESYSLYSLMMNVFGKFVLDMYNVQDLNSFLAFESDYVQYGVGVKEYLQSIILNSAYMPETTVRDALDKICNVAQINIFLDSNNKIHIVDSRPKYYSSESKIVIPKRNQYSDLQYDLTTSNVFDGIEISEYQKNEKVETEVAIYQTGEVSTSSLSMSALTTSDLNTEVSTTSVNSKRNYGSSTSGLSLFRYYGFLYAKNYYYSNIDSITLPKRTNANLSKILSMSTTSAFKDGQPVYKIIYKIRKYNCSANMNTSTGEISSFAFTVNQKVDNNSGNFASKYNYDYGGNDTLSLTISDSSTLTVTQSNDDYIISGINLLCARQYVYMNSSGYLISPDSVELTGTYVTYEPVGLQISFYGNTSTISFEEQDVSTENIEYSKNKISIQENILINQNTSYEGINISTKIKDNISYDYEQGIRTGTIKINPDNYYKEDGTIAKNWDNGDLIQVGDLIRIDKNNDGDSLMKYKDGSDYYWRVTGVKQIYDGEILLELQVQESIEYSMIRAGLYTETGNFLVGWNKLISDGLITVSSNTLTSVSGTLSGVLRIDDSITTIGANAFEDCIGLKGVVLTKNITTVGNDAFHGCINFNNTYYEGTVAEWCNIDFGNIYSSPIYYNYCKLFMKNGNKNYTEVVDIVIPNTVTAIKQYAFYNCISLKTITFEDNSSVESIGKDAFHNCLNLINFTLPNSLTSIGTGAFYYCTGLTSIIIPNSVKTINNNAFLNCSSVTNITIGTGVKTINKYAFGEIYNLEYVEYSAKSCNDSVGVSDTGIFEGSGRDSGGFTLNITDNVERIPEYSFKANSSSYLKELIIGKGVKYIGYGAFIRSNNLETIIYNATYCQSIQQSSAGNYVFAICGTNVSGGMSVTIGSNVVKIPAKLFRPIDSSSSIYDSLRPNLTTAEFLDQNGWTVNGQSINLSNTSTNATYLKTTYYAYDWIKILL